MMRCAFSLLFVSLIACCTFGKSPRLATLYRQLDAAIAVSDKAVAEKERVIAGLKRGLRTVKGEEAYRQNLEIYRQYSAYKNDSAIAALNRSIAIAREMQRNDRVVHCQVLKALQCSKAGLYGEGLTILRNINSDSLSIADKADYYISCNHLYGELAAYSSMGDMSQSYFKMADAYRDSIYRSVSPSAAIVLTKRESQALASNDFATAFRLNDRRLAATKPGSHEYGVVAFYRYLIYSKQEKNDEACYWLAQSALCDVRNAVMDQAALWNLAERLSKDGDGERAHRYIRFAWHAAEVFGTRVRSWQILPILSVIDQNYQESISHRNTQLFILTIVIGFLALLLIAALYYVSRQRKRLNQSYVKQAEANAQLYESNQLKETYIGHFLAMCSLYIDKMELQRRHLNKLISQGNYAEAKQLTRAVEETSRQLDEFYANFDKAFLNIFPHFIDDLNTLLRPEAQIKLSRPDKLSTPVRIFALIRLGIDDSTKIAELLHYSLNTIYNYRAKMKNGALGDRNKFEEKVKMLGKVELNGR